MIRCLKSHRSLRKILLIYEKIAINLSNFQALEVVGRGSETQPQVLEHSNKLL